MAPLMVGVSGLRGIVGESLTAEVAERFARAFGGWLRERSGDPSVVVLGADGRAGFEPIRDAAARGLSAAGCSIADLGVAMTPTVGIMADHLAAAGGLIVTASHNPQQWNGLKCLVRGRADGIDACAPDARAAAEIIGRFHAAAAGPSGPSGASRRIETGAEIHVERVLGALGGDALSAVRGGRARVLLDSVNGAGAPGGAMLLSGSLGCDLIHHGADPRGVFPHPPEPTRENLASLAAAVTKSGARVGFAQDPDADRLAIVDERGTYIGEEYTFVLAAEALLSDGRDARPTGANKRPLDRILVTNLSTSRMIDDLAARHGARVARTPVGEANVVEAMKRENAAGRGVVLGGEGNGGVIWPGVTYVRDSLSAMALTLALMARRNEPLSAIVASMPRYAIEKRKVDLACKEDARPAIDAVAAAYTSARIDLQDGVRIDWDDRKAWLHVRASNTEPIMRLIAEAPTEAEARAILDDAARVIAG